MVSEEIESGDYVKYETSWHDQNSWGNEKGAGYVKNVIGTHVEIDLGNRLVTTHVNNCEMVAKQYRLPL